MFWDYRDGMTFDKRLEYAGRLLKKYPDRIPIIVERRYSSILSKKTFELDQKKYLVPSDLTIGQFYFIIRKRVHLRAEDALFFFVGNQMPNTSATLVSLYQNFADRDKFLYITYSEEAKFG